MNIELLVSLINTLLRDDDYSLSDAIEEVAKKFLLDANIVLNKINESGYVLLNNQLRLIN